MTQGEDGAGAFAIASGSPCDPSHAILLLGIGQQRLPYAGGRPAPPASKAEACFLDSGHHGALAGNGHDVTGGLSGASDRDHRQKVLRPPRKRQQDAQRRRPFPCSATVTPKGRSFYVNLRHGGSRPGAFRRSDSTLQDQRRHPLIEEALAPRPPAPPLLGGRSSTGPARPRSRPDRTPAERLASTASLGGHDPDPAAVGLGHRLLDP